MVGRFKGIGRDSDQMEDEHDVEIVGHEPAVRSVVHKVWPDGRQLAPPPDSRATLITDRVGRHLTTRDRSMKMQNDVANCFWELARKIDAGEVTG